MLKRLTRLEPPYVASIVLCIALVYLSLLNPYYRGKAPDISLPQVLLHLGYLNIYFKYDWLNVVYWSLAIEFQFYILMAILFPLIVSNKKYVRLLLLIILVVLAYLFNDRELIFKHAPFFLFGISLFLFKQNKIRGTDFISFVFINSIFCYMLDDGWYLFFGLAATAVILFTEIKNTVSVFLGSISYSLYLLHVPIGQRMINITENFVHNEWLLLMVSLLCVLLMLLVSYLFYRLIEKPSQKLSKRITI